jgi:hypothetical protein
MWCRLLSQDFRGNAVDEGAHAGVERVGASRQSVVGISEPGCLQVSIRKSAAETEIIAVTTASALDVTWAAGGMADRNP